MKKRVDVIMFIATYIFVLYSSASFTVDGLAKNIPPTDTNIMILSFAAFFTVVVSNWKSFYVPRDETIWMNIKNGVNTRLKQCM